MSMTIIDAKPINDQKDEVVIDISQLIGERKELDPELSDMDRGIQLLSEALFAHAKGEKDYQELVNDLLAENERNQTTLVNFQASERRWNYWKWVGACLTVTVVATVLFADLFDQSLDTTEGTRRTVRRVLISVGAVGTALTAAFSYIAYRLEGKRHGQYENQLGLQQNDNEMVKKLRIVLENWGALQRSQKDYLSEVDVNKCAKQCFKNIKDLPEDKELPPKSCMASMTLQLLSDEHPAKQTAKKIKELEEEISPRGKDDDDNKGFVDLGQKGTLDWSSSVGDVELEIARQWKALQQHMGGLYIDEFYVDRNHISRRDAKL